jgi:hypothetical protein
VREWDAATGECVRTLIGHSDYVRSAVYSSDGKKILSASSDQTIKEWDTATGKCVRTLRGHSGIVFSAVYSGDMKKILSTSWDKTIKEWDAKSGQCLATYDRKTFSLPALANISQDSNILETGGNKISIKNKSTGAVIKTLVNIPGLWIQGCSFARLHPDCRLSEEELQLLKMYGAVVAEKNVSTAEDAESAESGERQHGDMEPVELPEGIETQGKTTEEKILYFLEKLWDEKTSEETIAKKLNEAVILQPKIFGVGVDLNKIFQMFLSKKKGKKKD